jgi:uncharacterized protein
MQKRPVKWLTYSFTLAAALYLLVLALLYFFQERLLFVPSKLEASKTFSYVLPHEEKWVDVPGAKLHAILLKNPNPRGLVFYLHGNGGNVEGWTAGADFYKALNYDLFMLDYRGYGKSTGRIESEAQLHADARAAYDFIAPAYAGKPIAIFGRSLGSGIATKLSIDVSPAITILISPYRSIRALATGLYPFVPGALVRYPLDTEARIAEVKSPLVLIHGQNDELIPITNAQALIQKNPSAKLFVLQGAHNDVHEAPNYRQTITDALAILK